MSGFTNYLRLRNGAIHLHGLGPRPVGEFLLEVGNRLDATDEILQLLDEWRRLTPEMVEVANGRRFPALLQQVPK